MPLQATSGAASYDGFGGGVAAVPNYIEDVFSTWLYPGNSSTQTITNGIDLTGKGGMVWIKVRDSNYSHRLTDSSTSFSDFFASNENVAKGAWSGSPPVFQATSSGFNLNGNFNQINVNTVNYASWTFRKQPKFFDVVTYTGTGSARTVAHSLGSVPGCIIVKRLDFDGLWRVYHRSLGATKNLKLNLTDAEATDSAIWNDTAPTATEFTVGINGNVNASGSTYVAYIFAHDAGGFGLTGTDNVISCGSFTTDGSGEATVTLGYEPQWALIKPSNSTGDWVLVDTMRSWVVAGNNDALLYPNSSSAEVTGNNFGNPTATGFQVGGLTFSNTTYIYIAIRRGPMKTPTTGTSVYNGITRTGTGAAANVTAGFAPDLLFYSPNLSGSSGYAIGWFDRLRGTSRRLVSNTAGGESNYGTDSVTQFGNTAVTLGVDSLSTGINFSGQPSVDWMLGRAPGFFDVVCYTGDAADPRSITHNLTATPELMIVKRRDASANWRVYSAATGATNQLFLNLTDASAASSGAWSNTAPTSSAFTVGFLNNASGATYVAYLFASVAGVSKVGTYTGTGALQTINCGFTGGARFVLVKATSTTGDWYVWDSARGISSSTDPYLLLNSTAAEVTGTNWVDTTSTGFQVTAASGNLANTNGVSYIFLAVA
jgi:hypothetical protein